MKKPVEPREPSEPKYFCNETLYVSTFSSVQDLLDRIKESGTTVPMSEIELNIDDDYGSLSIQLSYNHPDSDISREAKLNKYNKEMEKYKIDYAKYLADLKLWLEEQSK